MSEEHKCKDCKWLTGKKNIRGIECMNPKNQEKWNKAKTLWMGELRKDSARYKQGSALACKKFEAKEQKMSKDTIYREDAIKTLQENVMFEFTEDEEWAITCLKNLPSADRPQGEWIRDRYWSRGVGMGEEYGFFYKCSLCEYEVEDGYTRCGFNYCPYCGSRMKGADDE